MVPTNLKDLETTGYTVIKGYLSPEEVRSLVNTYSKELEAPNGNYYLALAPKEELKKIAPKIVNTLKQVSEITDIRADLMLSNALYADNRKFFTTWHQDHESFYYFQQNYHYLNFYLILKKEDANKSGLSIVPFDKLKDYPQFDKIKGSGAKTFHPQENSTVVISQENGEIFNIPVNIDHIALTPALEPGDLLLLRGDTIHQTQDNDTDRLALSIRCTKSDALIDLAPLENPHRLKQNYIDKNLQPYLNLKEKLRIKGSITAEEAVGESVIAKIS